MKRFLLFGGNHYYAGGGWNDLLGSYDTADEAAAAAVDCVSPVTEKVADWWHVVDATTGTVVSRDADYDGWGNL